MRIRVYISAHAEGIAPDTYRAIAREVPSAAEFRDLSLDADETDHRVTTLRDMLATFGYKPRTNLSQKMDPWREYVFYRHRVYDGEDLAPCELIQLEPRHRCDHAEIRTQDEFVSILLSEMPASDNPIATSWVTSKRVLIRDRMRKAIDAGGFIGPTFRTVHAITIRMRDKSTIDLKDILPWETREPWWDLTSSVELPCWAPVLELHEPSSKYRPLPHGTVDQCVIPTDPGFTDAQLPYFRRDLAAIGPFDFAVSRERSGDVLDRYYICSQRFYQFCLAQGCDCIWRPVRIID